MFSRNKESLENNTECGKYTTLLMITANVGSLFEDSDRLLQQWIMELVQKISELEPQFFAIHLQEVGGKTYEKSLECVQEFIQSLCDASELKDYTLVQIYMDEDFNSAEHFTALGNLYFGHKSLKNVKTWNFLTHAWESIEEKNIYSGNIETIATKEKSKFPQNFFPECKWSRKGFMRSRWEINGTVIDLVNIHLFHDASNFVACEEFPSVYCKTRRRALVHTLERFHLDDKNGVAPYFIFGDFNFRCDTMGVIKELTENLTPHRIQSSKGDNTKLHYRNSKGNNILTIGKKEFNYADHQLKFKDLWLKKFDKELDVFTGVLNEYPVSFPPTYPFEEDPEMPNDYMSTRCPSWCDRILISCNANDLILGNEEFLYDMIGNNVCMGDHKPIFLNIRLKTNQGTYRCCKCYLYKNYNNSTSQNPAVLLNEIYPKCPYKSEDYRKLLKECRGNIKNNHLGNLVAQNKVTQPPDLIEIDKNEYTMNDSPICINIIDSDNISVCMCSQMPYNLNTDGTVCQLCQNIIKKQPIEHRYRLVSKRLLLSENLIVNRIDTQYLNTKQQEDILIYTPESIESHSPYPELSSTSTSTASNSRSSPFDASSNVNRKLNDYVIHDENGKIKDCIVSPGQLKSRLEDLQKLSEDNVSEQSNAVGCSDVENVAQICLTPDNKRSSFIKFGKVPETLQKVVYDAMDDEMLWKEQSQVEIKGLFSDMSVKSRYIQISPVEKCESANPDQESNFNQDQKNPDQKAIMKETTV